jgi:predicted site-specific integrase-resolvase
MIDHKQLLTRKQAAELLGIHPITLHEWRKTGFMPAILKGKRHYYDPADLSAKIKRTGTTEPATTGNDNQVTP